MSSYCSIMNLIWLAALCLAVLLPYIRFTSWTSLTGPNVIPRNNPIEPREIQARLDTIFSEYEPSVRHFGQVYLCHGEDWGPPCFVYYPKLNYTCSALGPELSGHVGSIYVEPGIICRLCILSAKNTCLSMQIFAWPEIKGGWPDVCRRKIPGGDGFLGNATTHFACALCTACGRA
ncbi:hypothetical protein B0J13DRAFT_202819 [Dactylonectria estremocensis]|uniref:Uncharacterized protein n=2 Tax=Dactylonectria estremocensis TaxID=1079267 RepID=A0A9P9DB75_9HYPO|nr:hypothetical protein B0J13DRAFT_202819 [Dactylonectria estremocensis]